MQWTWVWVSSGSWWWTGRPVVLQSKASQELDTTVWLNWVELWVATEVVFWRQNCDVYNGTSRNMPAVYLHESCGYKRGWPVQVDQGYIVNYNLWVCLLSSFSRVWLLAAMWIIALSDSSAHEILQARILEWVAMLFSGDLPDPVIEPMSLTSPPLAGRFFTTSATWEDSSKYMLLLLQSRTNNYFK